MNKRIEQLTKHATIRVNYPTVNSSGKVICDNWEEGVSLSKFAELIVRECMEQVWYTREDVINGNISEVIKERMKQHFGIE